MTDKKRYYFAEVNIPEAIKTANADLDPAEILKIKLDEYVTASGTKNARALKDMIYEDIKIYGWHPTEATKTAYCLTFINARHWDAFKVYTPDFRTWLNDTHSITYTHEAHSDLPYEIADKDNLNGAAVSHEGHNMNYEVAKHKAFLEDLPASRGFEFN